MTMLANRTETRALTLADYEARIHLYKEQIGVGYIGIGRTLNEAKAAQVVPHGQWEAWVTETTGLTPRQAQRCMKAATEIRDGSAMAQLEMSKALLLLGSGLDADAQEAIAAQAAEEGATVKALREEIRQAKAAQEAADAENERSIRALKLKLVQETGTTTEIRAALKKAEEDRDGLKHQLEATIKAYQQRMDEEAGAAYRRGLQDKAAGMEHDIRKEFQGKIDFLNSKAAQAEDRVRDLKAELEASRKDGSQQWDKGYQAAKKEIDQLSGEYADLQERLESARKEADGLRRNQGDLLAAAEEAEKRAADAEAELEALRAAGPEGKEPAWKTIKTATDRFLTDCEMLPIWDGPGILRGEQQVEPCLDRLEMWLKVMRETLAGCIPSEGAVL
jgi:hypothetical protein